MHYVVNGKVYSLWPAEYQRFAGTNKKQIVFHPGDDLSDAEQVIGEGIFVFGASERGWELKPMERDVGQRLLEACRIATPNGA